MHFSLTPERHQLYDPAHESDSCGVAMIADIAGRRSHAVVRDALQALADLDHRGARGAEPNTGDGAGILLQIPDELFRSVPDEVDLPESGSYAAGICFLPADPNSRQYARGLIETITADEGLRVLGWRDVRVNAEGSDLGAAASSCMPHMSYLFVADPEGQNVRRCGLELDRAVYCLRKRAERDSGVYFASLSARTIVFKGMLLTSQLPVFYPDLADIRCRSALAVVHSRFSTNTFPSWPLAQPFRFTAHNGEINTIRGNRNRMRARESMLASPLIPGDLSRAYPICTPGASDSASLDEVLELLHLAGRPIPHVLLMMIPQAWENDETMDPAVRAFYRFHASLTEPWDGPACVVATDGSVVAACLDRNGLRPGRWWRTFSGRIILASESGVLPIDDADIAAKGRLEPGTVFVVDTAAGRIVPDAELKAELAAEHPYKKWLDEGLTELDELPKMRRKLDDHPAVVGRQIAFGYTEEDLRVILTPMARTGAEPLGSMGTDTPVAVLSTRPRMLYDYFAQLFAQVTNPPLDAIREEIVTSLNRVMGPEGNLLEPGPHSCQQMCLSAPVLDNDELDTLVRIDEYRPQFTTRVLKALFDVERSGEGLADALADLRMRASRAVAKGASIIVISDRDSDHQRAPIPSLLAVSAVHHHLIRQKERTRVALVVESGDAREVHHVALLIGFGAAAVNPYIAMETVADLVREREITEIDRRTAVRNYLQALSKGVLKVMSKMGISTVGSYTAAQVFEAVGLDRALVDEYFTGTSSTIGGAGLDVLAHDVRLRHRRAYPDNPTDRVHRRLDVGGDYLYRREGELHLYTPESVFLLQHATRSGQFEYFRKYTAEVNRLAAEGGTLRGLFSLRTGLRPAVPIEEVEAAESIVKRFNTGAMSYGSISAEAHETLAIAMNSLGGRSNSGEGGEDRARLYDPQRRSAVKQVASGRFGVTSDYLVNATDIQIKIAQGAKPGEGGQLPGFKVYPAIARTRHSTPGVALISPPPHHDIYSIEDLAQLIHDLKNANPLARINVKLVSSVGVGTVAAGVSKAHADVVLISGHDGGTGAAPLTSLKHAGTPWEIGLAETQQTLVLNGLRDRITVQVDGGMRTGRDVVVAALLGAEEFGFSTAPLVVAGCIMMRVCHLDTCPVGIATQNPELRKRYTGKPEFIENFFLFIAEEVREYLAEMGMRSVDEAIGHTEMLNFDEGIDHWKAAGLDLSPILKPASCTPALDVPRQRRRTRAQDHGLERALDHTLIQLAEGALEDAHPVRLDVPIRNVNRTVGTLLSSEVTRRYGAEGLPDDTIHVTLTGSAGQSVGAFLVPGVTLDLVGDANDYAGKGMCGGRLIVRPSPAAKFRAEEHVIAGNTLLYGATSGEAYFRGCVGERFAVRNSGATAIVEAVGDHGCEYMTGGLVIVLGRTGRNFAAGMSGGVAYVLDLDEARVNLGMVTLQEPEATDIDTLHEALRAHHTWTFSPVAAALLDNWPSAGDRFTKVMPRDYERVLEATRRAQAEGRDIDAAVMEAAGG
ncbi:glutamate synthase large subunit [Hoyosella sp. YIM 151337]|uniref:glutamate synthase large subunit n=1 Tax=Hoyosella sp. YIM 151337 TaxID=2992742 RepID=UPI002235A41F|nr:glutamate synthase large subunit [Hoyosella sp. YIM 151337]MCW4355590.1 glutamate synthase large subunit [Hoyosella sp. YIM 151337]